MGGLPPMTEAMAWGAGLVLAFILADWLTGTGAAAKERRLSSSVMREGLWHKAGEVAVVALAYMLEVGSAHLDLGFTAPLFVPACVYVVLNETASILENVAVLNPELKGTRIMQLFKSAGDEGEGDADGRQG